MIPEELAHILKEAGTRGETQGYARNLLKEYLQMVVLSFLFTQPNYNKNLIFTGGTCLRHFFGLERLSEDLDFDYLKKFPILELKNQLLHFFKMKYLYPDISGGFKQQGQQILLKFPVLRRLGLAKGRDSDVLHIKIDLSQNPSRHYGLETTSKSRFGFNFAARHYDLPSLMAGKVHAILMRWRGEGVKGRDYFDLLWYLKNAVKPNLPRLADMLGEKHLTPEGLERRLDEKVRLATTRHKHSLVADLIPLLKNAEMVKLFIANYHNEYLRTKGNTFREILRLSLVCNHCGKKFSAGISIERRAFETVQLLGNTHVCHFCGHPNPAAKADYLLDT